MVNGTLDDMLDVGVIYMSGNVGISNFLFDNPHYKHRLASMGMHPDNAFRCAMNFLFAPSQAVQKKFADEFQVMSNTSKFKIAIQLRLGDSFLNGRADKMISDERRTEPDLQNIQHFFACAETLEQTFMSTSEKAIWFVVSDSLEVRRIANATFPDKVITRVVQPEHVYAAEEHTKLTAMIETAGEHWLIGMSDYQIISRYGNFGKTASLRKHAWHTIYRLPVEPHLLQADETVCNGLTARAVDFGEMSRGAPFIK